MPLTDNENIIMKIRAEAMFFNAIRRGRYTLVLTNRRILLNSIWGTKEAFELSEIDSVELYRVALFLPFGIRFHLQNGQKLELSVMNNKLLADMVKRVCPQVELVK